MALYVTYGRILVGDTIADQPDAGEGEAQWPGTLWFAKDGSQPEVTRYVAPNVLGWVPFNAGGGGGVTINTTSPLAGGTGLGVLFNLSFSVTGQTVGDLLVYVGGSWTRLPAGTNGFVLTMVAGAPAWAAPGGTATVSSGDGTQVTGGPAYVVNVFVAGQADGDLLVRQGGAWVRLPAGTNGFVLTMVAGAPAWAASGGGSTFTSGDGIVVTGGPAYVVSQGYAGQVSGDLSYFNGTNWVRFPVTGADGGVPTADTLGPDRIVVYRQFSGSGGVEYVYAGGHTFKIGFPAQVAGTLAVSIGGPGIDWGPILPGIEGSRLTINSGFPAWVPNGATFSPDFYLAGTTGNDANDGLTPLTPVKTIARVMELLPEVCTGFVRVNTAAEPGAEVVRPRWSFPWAKGNGGAQFVLFDAPLVEVLPAEAATGGAQGFGTSFGFVLSTSVLVPNVYKGLILEWVTGPNAGLRYRVATNTVAALTVCGQFLFAPNVGDQFRVVQEGAPWTLPPPSGGVPALLAGAGAVFSGFSFDLNGNGMACFGFLALNCSSFRGAGGQLILAQIGQLLTASTALLSPVPTIGFSPECGPEFTTGLGVLDGARAELTGYRFENAGVVVLSNAQAVLLNGYHTGTTSIEVVRSSLEATSIVGDAPQANAFIKLSVCASGTVTDLACSATSLGPAVLVENNSFLFGNSLQGSVNTGAGVECRRSSRCQIPDASTTTTITGVGGDCQVGSNAAPSSWAQIFAGAVADVTDLTAAVPEFCAVQV